MKWPWAKSPHVHTFQILWEAEHAEIDENNRVLHTNFLLMACKCRHVEAVPKENFALCTARYKNELQRHLAELNWHLEEL